MRWPWSGRPSDKDADPIPDTSAASQPRESSSSSSLANFPAIKQFTSWTDSLNKTDWTHYRDPHTWVPPALAVGAALGFSAFYRSYLRRIPTTNHIRPNFFRKRSLLGRVTSVGDGDNFHMFHTPGGRLAGWGWLRKVPSYRKDLKGKTIPVRIAGVDAPECAHFGRPAQPYSGEALDFLTQYLLGRRIRAYLYRRDQYDRVVARIVVRRFFFFKRDVGLEMIKRGLATCYEAKTGAEFGGREAQYRIAEAKAKAKKKGMWSGKLGRDGVASPTGELESPREYKTRMAALDAEKGAAAASSTSSTGAAATATSTTASLGTANTASHSTPSSSSSTSSSIRSTPSAASTSSTTPAASSSPASPASPAAASPAKPAVQTTTPSPSQAAGRPIPGHGGGKGGGSGGWGKGPLPSKR
ncbi:putative endonuclease lcl3 [Sporothrix curviconia]|uniref:Probable endonuclease LCL3 n=1 Tax=Sporothrix curviconia TaxID=1260050 RepID=A0ABP0B5K0_9PEZI